VTVNKIFPKFSIFSRLAQKMASADQLDELDALFAIYGEEVVINKAAEPFSCQVDTYFCSRKTCRV
jgi:hypothetical protein